MFKLISKKKYKELIASSELLEYQLSQNLCGYTYTQLNNFRKLFIYEAKRIDNKLKDLSKSLNKDTRGGGNYKPLI